MSVRFDIPDGSVRAGEASGASAADSSAPGAAARVSGGTTETGSAFASGAASCGDRAVSAASTGENPSFTPSAGADAGAGGGAGAGAGAAPGAAADDSFAHHKSGSAATGPATAPRKFPPKAHAGVVRIACVSDTHSHHWHMPPVPEGEGIDVLVHGGDFTAFGKGLDDFAAWLESVPLPTEHKLVVLGNHENRLQFEVGVKGIKKALSKGGVLLHRGIKGKSVEVLGVRFHGFGFMPERYSEDQPVKIPEGTHIVVTHNPPVNHLDNHHRAVDSHLGHISLGRSLDAMSPPALAHIFGHMHHCRGTEVDSKTGTVYVNAATCNHARKAVNKPVVIDVDKDARTVVIVSQ